MKLWPAISMMTWCCLLVGCPEASSNAPALAVKDSFTSMDAGRVRGKTLREIISPEEVRLIALIESRGKGSPLLRDFTPEWNSDRLMETIFSSNERASDLSLSATETVFAKYAIVSKVGDLFILDAVGSLIERRPVTAVLLAGDGFGCRFHVGAEGILSAETGGNAAASPSQEETLRLQQALQRDLLPITQADAHWEIVQKEITQIIAVDPASPVCNRLEMTGRIQGTAIQTLFPGWSFYAFTYSNRLREGFPDDAASVAAGLGHTLAVGPDGTTILRLYYWGNYEDYGRLLAATDAKIRGSEDAQLTWDAFCELHRKFSKTQKLEQVSDNEWRLGIARYDQVVSVIDDLKTVVGNTHYFRVVTDPADMRVATWESVVERSPERREKAS